MDCTEAYKEHIMYSFNGFCKVVIRYAAINTWRDRNRRRQREISFEYLTEEKFYPLSTSDEALKSPYEQYPVTICGQIMEPSATKAARPCLASSVRIKCWSSARAMTFAASSFGVLAYRRPCSTQTGRKSNRIFSNSRALIVRPLAGNPTSKRRVTRPERTSQSVRSSTSWPGMVTASTPLFPEPWPSGRTAPPDGQSAGAGNPPGRCGSRGPPSRRWGNPLSGYPPSH